MRRREFLRGIGSAALVAGLAGKAAAGPVIDSFRFGSGAFTPITNTYDTGTAATETVPAGATQVVIETWGGGGSGSGSDAATPATGCGAGSGGYVKKTIALAPSDAGKTFIYSVGAAVSGGAIDTDGTNGNATTCANGTYGTVFSLNAGGGGKGLVGVGQGSGGTATGGDVNTAGNGGGGNVRTGRGAPNGGGDVSAGTGSTPGGGGAGGNLAGSSGGASAAGRARFAYT